MLAEWLHQIPPCKPQFIPWQALYQQYGGSFAHARAFRSNFLRDLQHVQAVYKTAHIEETKDNTGHSASITLFLSLPPVLKINVVRLKPSSAPSWSSASTFARSPTDMA